MNVFPWSGPADGSGGVITVHGYGFNTNSEKAKCKIDGKEYDVISVSLQELVCNIPPSSNGPNFNGNVPLEITVNGVEWHEITGGFDYFA